ncbi:extracellular solute-binding protein [Oceanisphaera pacifica]|uniref:Extracellular solute-binding protein n=1 Tax=Oceanisphaera pacifica TaxID=2818389 RepID=A0ABS3NGU0_9GAMM|nr:extracellular solute-binding protein [Oceanisphaera pacifica]MBO1519495.1 extracellular solute-binding protein [Oceanisphaera pacifica]
MPNSISRRTKVSAIALSTLMLLSPLSANAALTIYNGQHKTATLALIDAFSAKTDIEVVSRQGSSNELAHQIVEEGHRSPADIIYTEESTPLIMLANKGLLTSIDAKALSNIPAEYRDPDGKWVGLLARSRVIAYNKDNISPDQLPTSVHDLTNDKWKDQFAFVKTSGAFQKQLSAMIKLDGKEKATAWLEGLSKNGKVYRHNKAALDAVERGDIAFALINNYYWDNMAREKGADNLHSALYFMGTQDLGDLVTVSGAAIVASSQNKDEAQQFMAFATSKEGQQILTDKSAQYPLNTDVDTHGLKPFSELTPPNDTLDLGEYSDGKAAIELLQEVGLL